MTIHIGLVIGLMALCYIVGYVVGRASQNKNAGIFLVDDSDDEKTRWTLDVHMDPDDIPKKKYLRFRVFVQK